MPNLDKQLMSIYAGLFENMAKKTDQFRKDFGPYYVLAKQKHLEKLFHAISQGTQSLNTMVSEPITDATDVDFNHVPALEVIFKSLKSEVVKFSEQCPDEMKAMCEAYAEDLQTAVDVVGTLVASQKMLEQTGQSTEAQNRLNFNVYEMRTKQNGLQKQLQELEPTEHTEYGYAYDYINACMNLIDQNPDLIALTGTQYGSLKAAANRYKKDIENAIADGLKINQLNTLANNLDDFEKAFQLIGHTQAFDRMRSVISSELSSYVEFAQHHPESTYRNLLQKKEEPVRRDEAYRNQLTAEMEAAFYAGMKKELEAAGKVYKRNAALEGQLYDVLFSDDEPYVIDKVSYSGKALEEKLMEVNEFTIREITRRPAGGGILMAALELRGINEATIKSAFDNPNKQESSATLAIIKDTREELFDMITIKDPKQCEEKIADFYVRMVEFFEGKIAYAMNSGTNESILKLSNECTKLQSVFLQSMPRALYNEKGQPLISGVINEKLKELGKPYTFEQMDAMLGMLGNVGTARLANGYNDVSGEFVAHNCKVVRDFFKEAMTREDPLTAIADVDEKLTKKITSFLASSDGMREVPAKTTMQDMQYYYSTETLADLDKELTKERKEHGASKLFANVISSLKAVELLEKNHTSQESVNDYYNHLERACNKYLENRNPWTEEGKNRYKLIVKVANHVANSRRFRVEQQIKEQKENKQIDNSFTELYDHFIARTDSGFGDSEQMEKIKKMAQVLEYDQRIGMVIPAYDSQVCWYDLVKACADYISNPKKAENSRKAAVREVMDYARIKMKDKNIDQICEMVTNHERQGVVQTAFRQYEKYCKDRDEAYAKQDKFDKRPKNEKQQALTKLMKNNHKLTHVIGENRVLLSLADKIKQDTYIDGVFAADFIQNKEMKKNGVYNVNANKEAQKDANQKENKELYNPPKIAVNERGLEILGLGKDAFSYLALINYIGDVIPNMDPNLKGQWNGDAIVSGLIHNIDGSEQRQGFLSAASMGFEGFMKARENTAKMLEDIAAKTPVDQKLSKAEQAKLYQPLAKMMGDAIKKLKPDAKVQSVGNHRFVAHRVLASRVVDILVKCPEVVSQMIQNNYLSKKELVGFLGAAKVGDALLEAGKARLLVADSMRRGVDLEDQQMKQAYKAILKEDIIMSDYRMALMKAEKANQLETEKNAKEAKELTNQVSLLQKDLTRMMKENPNNPKIADLKNQIRETQVKQVAVYQKYTTDTTAADYSSIELGLGQMGTEWLDQAIEKQMPANVTMDQLGEMLNPDRTCEAEYKAFVNSFGKSKDQEEKQVENQAENKLEKQNDKPEEASKDSAKEQQILPNA